MVWAPEASTSRGPPVDVVGLTLAAVSDRKRLENQGKAGESNVVSDTVTLALEGTVSLSDYSAAVFRFAALLTALAAESQAEDVAWEIEALEYSSAITTARGVSRNGGEAGQVDRVVRAYLEVGEALEQGTTIPYSPRVGREARAIADVLKGSQVEAIRFETAEDEAIVREVAIMSRPSAVSARQGAYGSVTGRIQTLTGRNALRFTVYDHIYDRAVSCYLVEGRESMMRQMWDRVATVEGWITRDPETGRPLTVRRVSNVTPLAEGDPQDYTKARGALPFSNGDECPENVIRRLRDAG